MDKISTPALAAFAAGRRPEPLGFRRDGRAIYPIAGGAEATGTPETPGALPSADDLQGMEPDALQTHREAIEAEARDLEGRDDADLTDGDVERLEALADHLDALDGESARREQVAQERADRAQAARERLNRDPEDEGDPQEGDPAPEGDPEDAPAADPENPEAAPAPEAVAAGAARPRAPRPAPRRNPKPAGPEGSSDRFSIVAAGDLGGNFSAGQTLPSMADAALAFESKSQAFPLHLASPEAGIYDRKHVARIQRNYAADPDGLWHGNKDFRSTQDMLVAAANESRLKDGSLVAAGGWCAPSETMYGLVALETLDGIIDLPTVGVDRGGINFTPGPDFGTIYTDAGFAQTEAQAIAGTTKACVEVDCPDFTEVRLDAVGYCVKAPLLTRTAYPEAIQRWLEGTIVANQHKVAARLISAMRTALGAALAPTLTGTPSWWSTLSIVEWVIEMQRQAYRLAEGETLEVKIPRWVRAVLRADLANRGGIGLSRVTDQVITDHFADRGAAVQFILNYLEVADPLTSVAYPASFEVMVYPAGTFVKGTADVIALDTVYDTADLQTNVYTAAFVEDGVLLAKMQHGGARITVPVRVTGETGSAQIDDNLFTAQAETAGEAAV